MSIASRALVVAILGALVSDAAAAAQPDGGISFTAEIFLRPDAYRAEQRMGSRLFGEPPLTCSS